MYGRAACNDQKGAALWRKKQFAQSQVWQSEITDCHALLIESTAIALQSRQFIKSIYQNESTYPPSIRHLIGHPIRHSL
jgi:hypothetical protein